MAKKNIRIKNALFPLHRDTFDLYTVWLKKLCSLNVKRCEHKKCVRHSLTTKVFRRQVDKKLPLLPLLLYTYWRDFCSNKELTMNESDGRERIKTLWRAWNNWAIRISSSLRNSLFFFLKRVNFSCWSVNFFLKLRSQRMAIKDLSLNEILALLLYSLFLKKKLSFST